MSTDIRALTTEAEWRRAFPVLSQLRQDLTEQQYLDLLCKMREDGYRLFALFDGEEIVAVAGVGVRTNFYNGRHLFVYDLVTREGRRSEGHGGRLMRFLEDWARERNCERRSCRTLPSIRGGGYVTTSGTCRTPD